MAQLISDAEMAAILTDMVDSQVPALSLIKSPKRHIFKQPPIISYRKEKSLKDVLVREKLPLIMPQS